MHRSFTQRWTIFFSAIVLITLSSSLSAQDTYYVRFTDKNNNACSIDHPEAFLSPASIARRREQYIPIRQDDLPLTASYVSAITALADHMVYQLKWDNAMLVRSADTSFATKARLLPFVKSVSPIDTHGPSTVHKTLDPPSDRGMQITTLDTGFYGASQNQNAMIHINALHQRGYWGDSVIIAVMDAGFDNINYNDFFSKVYAEGRVLYTWNYVFDTSDVYSAPIADIHGAETFSDIAANIPYRMVGTAPNAKFLLFKTEDTRSEKIIEEYNWVHAAERADSMGAKVFSTSLGYTTFDASDSMYNTTYAALNGHTTPMAIAGNTAASKGILVINSAGNDGASAWHYVSTPADGDSVVAVGAVAYDDSITSFSGRGPNSAGHIKPNVCAQGQAAAVVLTTGVTSTSSGTSFSCPIMAGAFACLREAFPSAPCMTIVDAVQRSGNFADSPNDDYGYGIPDFGLAYDYLKILYPADTTATRVFVYPNPFSTSITINIGYILNGPINIDLYDLTGRKVWTTSYGQDTYANNILTLTPPDIATGSYILRINNSYSVRIVKKP